MYSIINYYSNNFKKQKRLIKKIVFTNKKRFFYVELCRTIYVDFLKTLYLNKDLSVKEAPPIFFQGVLPF